MLFHLLACFFFCGSLVNDVGRDNAAKVEVEGVAGRHDVVIIHHLDERLNTRALLLLLMAHAPRDLPWVRLDASDERVAVGPGIGALVVVAHNHGFLAGESALRQDDDLRWLRRGKRDGGSKERVKSGVESDQCIIKAKVETEGRD